VIRKLSETSNELDLHGLTSDEALVRVDVFLHGAFRSGYYRVRIIHGKGTGTLRDAVHRYLSSHPLVFAHRRAGTAEGGDGVTVVDLAEE
jgi:DNA mismatch repair protein MutS2